MKTPRKLKPMKRLPNNWADNLWDSDLDAILQHWQDRLAYYSQHTDGLFSQRVGSDDDIAVCQSRIALWTYCREQRRLGATITPIIRDSMRQTG